MSGGNIVYNFGSIEAISAQINAFVGEMNNTLGEVDSTFRNLIANGWTGAGAEAFQGQSAIWHGKADEMAQTLQLLAQKVSNASVNMQQADGQAAARFG